MSPPAQFRDYRLARAFGYTPGEIDEAPATRLDWLLACHTIVVQVETEQQKAANRG